MLKGLQKICLPLVMVTEEKGTTEMMSLQLREAFSDVISGRIARSSSFSSALKLTMLTTGTN